MIDYDIIKDLEIIASKLDRVLKSFPLLDKFVPMKEAVVKLDNMIDHLKTRKAMEK